MNTKKVRKYKMTTRAKMAAKTEEDIMLAAAALWMEYSLHDITLEMIADKANISVRTILRKYGSKEGLIEACLGTDIAGIQSIKNEAETGNIESIVATLMKEYELTGMAGIRTLAIEQDYAMAAKVLNKGREYHRNWCERVFAPYLPSKTDKRYNLWTAAFYAATDIYLWKLLRVDLKHSIKETEEIFKLKLNGIINETKQKP